MTEQARSKSTHILHLAKDLLDDIELAKAPAESLLLKATRLARLVDSANVRRWLELEMMGYNDTEPISLEYMTRTGRWTDRTISHGYWGPLAAQEAAIAALRLQLQMLRVPDISYAPSSANPNELVTLSAGSRISKPIADVTSEARTLANAMVQISSVRSRVLALIHNFAATIYYEKTFSGVTETIFERYKGTVDSLLAERCGEALERFSSVYDRLGEGDQEALSQALTSCRRIIDSFADAIYPPTDDQTCIEGRTLQLDSGKHLNRINAYIAGRVVSKSRKKKLRQAFSNLYDRVNVGVHEDVTVQEAQSLLLEMYLLLGEVLSLAEPPPAPTPEPRTNEPEPATGTI